MPVLHSPIAEVLICASTLLAGFFLCVFFQKRHAYLLAWAITWSLLALVDTKLFFLHGRLPDRAIIGTREWLLFLVALGFLYGVRIYARATVRIRWFLTAAVSAGFWEFAMQRGWFDVPLRLAVFFGFLLVARELYHEGKRQQTRADAFLALCFAAWGLLLFLESFQPHVAVLARTDLRYPMLLPQLFVAVLMVVVTYEEERRGLEGNILALSNLNLAASSFAGGEIQRMLGYALDRVLSLGRLPGGILCLHYGDSQGPKLIVSSGMTEGFWTAMQAENLDEYTLRLVARLGGLVVLRDLAREASWEALDREPSFHQVRQLLITQGLRTAVGISLQSKEQVFGVMLLGTPQNRRLTPPELRLLLALGQQIGLAVENSYLIQQTARRSEEMNTLNEIGRALSSTLEAEAIFEKISEEVRRLFHGSEFYIALYDSAHGEISLELEMRDGERQPKRRLPIGNHLIEYIIRSQQPLLIREHFDEEVERLHVRPRETAGSYCGVPLMLNERSVGALCMFSGQEGAFDDGQLGLLRVLASEASIALENARLFEEEGKKSRQLALVNAISRHAISTMNPEEMLAKITMALEDGLPYDHIGVALLDEAAQELVVRAEAGTRRGAEGRRQEMGKGLLGRAALSGELEIIVGERNAETGTMLSDSVSAAALSVNYVEQLLGVLYVETVQSREFSEDDLRLLRTAADMLAVGLHNALTLQKAQEQAITDGLTGVKTHRYLMEALSAEWKRSTRASRPFSVVMLDLDHFKFVNDTHGHLEGDMVLQVVARILEQNCRRSDVVARYGGDEFVILMPETAADQARQIAGKLRAWIAGERLLREKNVTASFGVASFPMHASHPQELIQTADTAMYASKRLGGNMVSQPGTVSTSEPNRWNHGLLESNLGAPLGGVFISGAETFAIVQREIGHLSRSFPASLFSEPELQVPAVVLDTLTSLALTLDARDPLMQGHSQRVAAYCVLAAQVAGLKAAELEQIRIGALLHDVGNLAVPEEIWRKPESLTDEEWGVMRTHAPRGAELLASVCGMEEIARMIQHHHEFFDGSGYPQGLRGKEIPRGARLIAICEAYDAMTTARPYSRARNPEESAKLLERLAGTQFDPDLVREFIEIVQRLPRPLVSANLAAVSPGQTNIPAN